MKSYIRYIDKKFKIQIGITDECLILIENLINKVNNEKLYLNHFPYHDINHIERVMCYCLWILNKMNNKVLSKYTNLVLYAALYHDCGRSFKISNKNHGVVGASIARVNLDGILDDKNINIIELLIETHAKEEDIVDFKNYQFTKEEKDIIQQLSNILKDADALDRNRIKLFKFAQCKKEYLRTKEALEIYENSDKFLKQYKEILLNN